MSRGWAVLIVGGALVAAVAFGAAVAFLGGGSIRDAVTAGASAMTAVATVLLPWVTFTMAAATNKSADATSKSVHAAEISADASKASADAANRMASVAAADFEAGIAPMLASVERDDESFWEFSGNGPRGAREDLRVGLRNIGNGAAIPQTCMATVDGNQYRGEVINEVIRAGETGLFFIPNVDRGTVYGVNPRIRVEYSDILGNSHYYTELRVEPDENKVDLLRLTYGRAGQPPIVKSAVTSELARRSAMKFTSRTRKLRGDGQRSLVPTNE